GCARPRRGAGGGVAGERGRRQAGGGRAHLHGLRRRWASAHGRAGAVDAGRGLPPARVGHGRGGHHAGARRFARERRGVLLADGGPRRGRRLRAHDPRRAAGGRLIRAVICDFGGVLTTPLVRSFLAFQEHSGISMGDLGRAMASMAEENGAHPLFELECGRLSERDFIAGIERGLGGGRRLEGFSEKYFEHLDRNEPMIECMRSLRDRGFRMAMLTNNVREWEPLWRAKLPEIDEIFELVVDSAFVGMRKPEPEIYELTVAR